MDITHKKKVNVSKETRTTGIPYTLDEGFGVNKLIKEYRSYNRYHIQHSCIVYTYEDSIGFRHPLT